MNAFATIREFRTTHFRVIVDALPEDSPVDVDDDGETAALVDAGELDHFIARCRVLHDALGEVGSDYLGGCIYSDVSEFEDHHACGAMNRQWAAESKPGRCGSYFVQLVKDAITEARRNLAAAKTIRVRTAIGTKTAG